MILSGRTSSLKQRTTRFPTKSSHGKARRPRQKRNNLSPFELDADYAFMTKFKEGPLVLLLRDGMVEEFNHAARQTENVDLSYANLRGGDLRNADLRKADLRNAYCHTADLRGVDLSQANIEGASFHRARISGSYFPRNVSAEELKMSVEMGTRIRLL